MPTLLVEIGNTTTRFAVAADGGMRLLRRVRTAELTPADATSAARRAGATAVAICSVVPAVTKLLRTALARLPIFVASARADLGFALAADLPRPARIGPDRLLGVAGALATGARGPLVVIDAGTACTFNVVDADGVFRGGAIAPGLAAFADYLADRTARLPRVRLAEIHRAPVVGRETRGAIAAACRHGFVGMAEGVVAAVRRELGAKRLTIRLTGGAAPLLAPAFEVTPEPTLVLRGLSAVADRWRDAAPRVP